MANLRTNNLSGEQGQNAYRGSVFFDGNSTGLRAVESDSNLTFGTGDFTIEFWIFKNNSDNAVFLDWRHTSGGNQGKRITLYSDSDLNFFNGTGDQISGSSPLSTNSWHHVALARAGSSIRLFVNGVQFGSTFSDSGDYLGPQDSGGIYIGRFGGGSYDTKGYISNLRIVKGTALYTSDFFTPPQSELTLVDGTSVLCCQDSDDPTQDAAGTTITANGSLATAGYLKTQPKVIPPYGVDAGNTFGGPIQQSSQGYMCFPTGRTEERGRGRAVFLGGGQPANTSISFIKIQSGGTAEDFGNISAAKNSLRGGSSSTRGLSAHSASTVDNTIEFITIATTGNSQDFGDMSYSSTSGATGTNDTRAVFWIGTNPSTNAIDFATIASLGNSADFGDMSVGVRHIDTMNSSTRCVIPGGWTSGGVNTNTIQFITFATTGNAQDFGDVDYTNGMRASGGFSSPTRGVFAGGADSPSNSAVNIIHFVTLASTGNSTDFGDISAAKRIEGGGTSSHIRGLIAGSNSPAQINTIEFVTIATTGNSQDFGDLLSSRSQDGYVGALSDCHGGLS